MKSAIKVAGFKDRVIPYLAGSSFHKPSDISDENLFKLILDATQDLRAGKYERHELCTFSGGYVLKIDVQDKYLPQCCGELSDIEFWVRISDGKIAYIESHPSPKVSFAETIIRFDFSDGESGEFFNPKPPDTILSIDRLQLKEAVSKAQTELQTLERRLIKINEKENLNIDEIGSLLIWGKL